MTVPAKATNADELQLGLAVAAFLYAEAALLDDDDLDAWLALFAEDGVYWIPSGADDSDPERHVSIVYDSHERLAERVWRLTSGLAYAQEPASRSVHLVSNVMAVRGADALVHVTSAFSVVEYRRGRTAVHAGRCRHTLREVDGAFSIVLKKVELIDNDGYLGNLSLIL